MSERKNNQLSTLLSFHEGICYSGYRFGVRGAHLRLCSAASRAETGDNTATGNIKATGFNTGQDRPGDYRDD
jgi:hypothetical protein